MQVVEFDFARRVAEYIEVAAIAVIAVSVVSALAGLVITRFRATWDEAFRVFKTYMTRGLLIGLDLLIAADIIKSVTLDPTLENILGLGLLVLIRTFLSWALVLEATGRWPWSERPDGTGEAADAN